MDVEHEGNRVAERIKFLTCCRLFEKLKTTQNVKARRHALSRFLQLWEDQYATLGSTNMLPAAGRASFYPCLRLLIPEADKTRPAYGLRETALARLYIKAFGIAPNGPVAQRLNNPIYAKKGTDFADILFEAVQDRCREDNLLSLKDANDLLDQLAHADNSEDRLEAMTQFIRNSTATEQKWMVRLIVRRRSGCGLGVQSVLQSLHPAAPGLWNVTQDLVILCQRIAEIDLHPSAGGKTSASAPDITLFIPFRPMLCERLNHPESLCQSVAKLCSLGSVDLSTAQLLLETKYDGERIQIHKSGSTYRYWSRNCLEWTHSYGGDGDLKQGSLTPRLHEVFRLDVHDCILDAEIMAYNTWTAALVPKTGEVDVKRTTFVDPSSVRDWFSGEDGDAYQPCIVVFDVVYLNGKSLTTTPLLERKRLLKELFVQRNNDDITVEAPEDDEVDYLPEPIAEGTVYVSRWCLAPVKVDAVSKVFNRLIDTRQEGLVAKLTVGTSPYLPGRRLHGGWWKLKPDYVEGLLVDLDCLVVGGRYASVKGRKSKRINHFICAVRDDRGQEDEPDRLPTFLSFCRVNSGLTTAQLKEINAKLRPHWRPYDRKRPNHGPTEWLRVTTERPDVWIAPQHSITFQIHASEITKSTSYATGLTLRFPRIVAVREDKPWQDCLTMQELTQINKETEGKMAVNRVPVNDSGVNSNSEEEMDEEAVDQSTDSVGSSELSGDVVPGHFDAFDDLPQASSTPTKKRKVRQDDRVAWRTSMSTSYDQGATGSGFLSNLEICVALPPDPQKTELESRIREVGGKVVQNAGPGTYCVVTDKLTAKIKNLIGSQSVVNGDTPVVDARYNIVRLDWLKMALDQGELIPWKPDDMWAMTKSTAKTVTACYDRFGDSFCDPIDPEGLRTLCTRMATRGPMGHAGSVHSLVASLIDELEPSDASLLMGPLYSCYILALPCSALAGSPPIRYSANALSDRLVLADLRRLGAVVFRLDCVLSSDTVAEAVRSVADQLKPYSNKPKLSHILLLGATFDREEINAILEQLQSELRVAGLSTPDGPQLVLESWARDCIRTESRCQEPERLL